MTSRALRAGKLLLGGFMFFAASLLVAPPAFAVTVVHDDSSDFAVGTFDNVEWNTQVGDPYTDYTTDAYTKLLLHMDGANGSTTFTDGSGTGKTVTPVGDTKLSTAQVKYGTASAYFDGAGDYLSVPDSDDWNFGSGDFTIDFWLNMPSKPSNSYENFFENSTDSNNRAYLSFDTRASNNNCGLYFSIWSTSMNICGPTNDANNWSVNT